MCYVFIRSNLRTIREAQIMNILLPLDPCDVCAAESTSVRYTISDYMIASSSTLCKVHNKLEPNLTLQAREGASYYMVGSLQFDYHQEIYSVILTCKETKSKPLQVITGYIELSLLLHLLQHRELTNSPYMLLVSAVHSTGHKIRSTVIDKYDLEQGVFICSAICEGHNAFNLGCRACDLVAISIICRLPLQISRQVIDALH